MGDRYIITGVQVGQIFAYAEAGEEQRIKELLKDIQDKQFVENTKNVITKDIIFYANAKINHKILNLNTKMNSKILKDSLKDIKIQIDKLFVKYVEKKKK